MNGFTITNFHGTASFEFVTQRQGSADIIDATIRIKYEFEGRTINSTHVWSLESSQISTFMENIESMHKTLKGCSSLISFDGDELYMTIDEYGHVEVAVKEGLADYNGKVEFKFEIDQSYLPDLIAQLKNFVETYR